MKKLLAVLTALMLLTACACAEELIKSTHMSIDLDSDGQTETVFWTELPVDEYVTEGMLCIAAEDGSIAEFSFGDMFGALVYIDDCDGDGIKEILISGDVMSDDYYTYALQYRAGELTQLRFANAERGNYEGGYADCGYGYVSNLGGGLVRLTGSQDFFGTYFASREYTLKDGVYEFADDGLFKVNWNMNDSEVWEFYAMTARQELPCTLYEGGAAQNAALKVGTRMILTACDRQSEAYFQTEDGQTVCLPIAFNEADGYGFCVYGTPEEELFDGMHYAD